MDINGLDAAFVATRRQAPDLFPMVNEDDHEAVFPLPLPLDERLMNLPVLQVEPDIAAPFPIHNLPPRYRGIPLSELLMKRFQPFVKLPPEWKEYTGLDYLALDEHLRQKWNKKQKDDTDRRLLQQIDTNSLVFVPTIGLQDSSMPPEFGPCLEPRPEQ